MSITQARTALVVLLTDLTVHGEVIPENTTLEVERAIRNDWSGSKLCRDATPEEAAEYLAQHGAEAEQDDKLRAELAQLTEQRDTLQAEVDYLGKLKEGLSEEVSELEARKAAAEKPAKSK